MRAKGRHDCNQPGLCQSGVKHKRLFPGRAGCEGHQPHCKRGLFSPGAEELGCHFVLFSLDLQEHDGADHQYSSDYL